MFNVVMSQGETSRKRMKSSSKQDETKAVFDVNTMRPSLPNLVIHRILELLPTKAAVRMSFLSKQWEGVWSLSPVIDFDESGKTDDDDVIFHQLVQHKNFINILQTYLEFREKDRTTPVLDKFKLHMRRYLFRDSTIVDKWLSFAFERSVKEVDLSLEIAWHKRLEFYYCISQMSFLNAKSLTTLNLEFVRIQNMYCPELTDTRVLPSLRNMSLKSVYFNSRALLGLIRECPSIECLSLTSCNFEDLAVYFSSSSLKSLKATHCNAHLIKVDEAVNLEYFTFSSEFQLKSMILKKCFNLKYINIHAQHLEKLTLHGCHESLKATIYTPRLLDLKFHGFLKSKVSLKCPYLRTTVILLWDSFDGESHFLTLRDFFKAFDGSDNITLYVHDFKVLICPQSFRETFSSPLCKIRELMMILLSNPPTKAEAISDLNDSLTWMAPSASRNWMAPSAAIWPPASLL